MFSRLGQVARHLSRRPLPNFGHSSSASAFAGTRNMAPSTDKRTIQTAACLIIGDEVLGGKTKDTNSHYFAKWCFGLGIDLKRVEVIPDEEDDIIEAVRRMSNNYDFVVTSGGIGPTHDDITYASIAKAFDLPLVLHQEAFRLQKKISKVDPKNPFNWDEDTPIVRAKKRMVELPTDANRPDEEQVVFPCEDLWVPVSIVNGNIHILPGVPRLFEKLLTALTPRVLPLLVDPEGKGTHRVVISTPLPESAVAEYLTKLAERVKSKNVKVGSYPHWGESYNSVTLVGKDKEFLDSITPEVLENVQGTLDIKDENPTST
ncbi:MoaB/Mog domain-containing protein [Podospora australis]|uniref:MoaB/Mog domain-containing protein n=1 Tax=Podospora australis TaxID=1536484 RepID=A0AAN7AHY4_9PEZI|nr:MoaB/Mog domain-containing protein [Podospora australis]